MARRGEGGRHGTWLHASRSGPRRAAAYAGRVRRLCPEWQPLGPPAAVHDLRACGLLRQLAEPARAAALPRDKSPDRAVRRTGRGLGLVLRRSDRGHAYASAALMSDVVERIPAPDLVDWIDGDAWRAISRAPFFSRRV